MTTTENAVEPVTLAIEQLADVVSGCAAFQESVRKYGKHEAREHIHKGFFRPADQRIELPFAIIFDLPGANWEKLADDTFLPSGQLFLHLGLIMEGEDGESEERRFNNWHGAIAIAIKDSNRRGAGGYVLRPSQTDPASHTSPATGEPNPRWEVGYTVDWGWR
jgi:hypothetical protein